MKFADYDRKMKKILAADEPYQGDRLARALPFCRQRRHALDVGAHIGLWTVQLANVFDWVSAFEPHQDSVVMLRDNVERRLSVEVFQFAIGNSNGTAYMNGVEQAFGAHIVPDKSINQFEVDMRTLDSFKLIQVDFIKLDVEGFETFAVEGGEQLIRRDRPVMVVEQKHESRYGLEQCAAVTMLEKWGATIEWKIKHDFCLRWK